MNKTYTVVFNVVSGLWSVAGEFAKGRKKSARTMKVQRFALLSASLLLPTHSALADTCASSTMPLQRHEGAR